jgi:putative membrane protein
MKTIIHFLVSALITAYVLPGVYVDGFFVALVLAVVLGVVNTFVRPVLIILTLPLTVLTLGISVLFINALLIMLAGYIVPGFAVASFWSAFLFGIVLAIISWVMGVFEIE